MAKTDCVGTVNIVGHLNTLFHDIPWSTGTGLILQKAPSEVWVSA